MLRNVVTFLDGIAEIYTVENSARRGDKPAERLVNMRKVRFGNRTVGAVRKFTADQAGIKLDRLIIVPLGVFVSAQDIVILSSENEDQYRIVQLQFKTDTKPKALQISLERLVQKYDKEVTE